MPTARPCTPMPPARGFTLLELLVVLVILGLLAGYVAPKYFSQIGKSEVKTAQAQIGALEKALDQYRIDTGHYPEHRAVSPATLASLRQDAPVA